MKRSIILTTALALGGLCPAFAQYGSPSYGGGSGTAGAYGNGFGMSGSGLQPFPLGAPANTLPQTYQPSTGGLGSGFAQYGMNSLPAAPIIPTMRNYRYDLRPDPYDYWSPPKLRDTSGMWKNGASDDRWLHTKTSATMGGAEFNLDPLPRSGRMYMKESDLRFGGSSMADSAYGRLLRRLDGPLTPGTTYVDGKPVEMPRTEGSDAGDERSRPMPGGESSRPATIPQGVQKPMQPQMEGTIGAPKTPD